MYFPMSARVQDTMTDTRENTSPKNMTMLVLCGDVESCRRACSLPSDINLDTDIKTRLGEKNYQ